MIKRKRKLNKQALINVRRYTIVGNLGHSLNHFFDIGECVEFTGLSDYYSKRFVNASGLEQWVSNCDVI